MPIFTRQWSDPKLETDGWRILICRYRPRGLLKKNETWDVWFSQLAPSVKLHAQAYGKITGVPISWEKYSLKYCKEMEGKDAQTIISCLAKLISTGSSITLLCSSACKDEQRCHRSLLKKLIQAKIVADLKKRIK